MSRYLFPLFIISIFQIGLAQQEQSIDLKIEYDIYANTESPRKLKGILQTSKINSWFVTIFNNKISNKKENTELNYYFYKKGKNQTNSVNIKDSVLSTYLEHKGNSYKVNESLTDVNWKVDLKKTKEIRGYQCNQATMSFRGRDYIAWFTTELPLPFGPWKFNGLPGLILDIADDTDRFHWVATSIEPIKTNVTAQELKPEKKHEDIDLQSFILLKEGTRKTTEKSMAAKLPRGVKMKTSYKRNGIEVQYEWEK